MDLLNTVCPIQPSAGKKQWQRKSISGSLNEQTYPPTSISRKVGRLVRYQLTDAATTKPATARPRTVVMIVCGVAGVVMSQGGWSHARVALIIVCLRSRGTDKSRPSNAAG